jgi:hypothetical protein
MPSFQSPPPIYEHCARALDTSLAVGGHGLPLIGGGEVKTLYIRRFRRWL